MKGGIDMHGKIRWGILGTGKMAGRFTRDLQLAEDAEIAAVGSRSLESADKFGDMFSVQRRYGSYEELACDRGLDVIYVATPHPFHKQNTLQCLHANKSVLCEKPFAINAREAAEMIACARERKLFLMEALWVHFLPVMVKLRGLLSERAIGELRILSVDYGYSYPYDPLSRVYAPALGGGALLDIGIYPVSLATALFGKPERITSLAHLAPSGVDAMTGAVLSHAGGRMTTFTCSADVKTPGEAVLTGMNGRIRIPSPWWKADRLIVSRDGEADVVYETPFLGMGFLYQIQEVMRCLRTGKLESEIMPWSKTFADMAVLDEIRTQCGVRYPME